MSVPDKSRRVATHTKRSNMKTRDRNRSWFIFSVSTQSQSCHWQQVRCAAVHDYSYRRNMASVWSFTKATIDRSLRAGATLSKSEYSRAMQSVTEIEVIWHALAWRMFIHSLISMWITAIMGQTMSRECHQQRCWLRRWCHPSPGNNQGRRYYRAITAMSHKTNELINREVLANSAANVI